MNGDTGVISPFVCSSRALGKQLWHNCILTTSITNTHTDSHVLFLKKRLNIFLEHF